MAPASSRNGTPKYSRSCIVRVPPAMSAEALSQALFGDAGHLVAARAEVSRLRRQLGGIVATRPYRLTDGVQLTLTQNAHRGS